MGLAEIIGGVKPSADEVVKASKKSMKLGVFLLSFSVLFTIILIVAVISELIGSDEGSMFVDWVFSETVAVIVTVSLILPGLFAFKMGVQFFNKEENGWAEALSDVIFGPAMFLAGAGFISIATFISEEIYSGQVYDFDELIFANIFTLIVSSFTVIGLGALLYGFSVSILSLYRILPILNVFKQRIRAWVKRMVEWKFHIGVYRYARYRDITLFRAYLEVYYGKQDISVSELILGRASRLVTPAKEDK
ncbi:hypothetical protein HTZ84_04935 [Haloterrigena sp. SYSU A558-1]|uniref:Uncharacterized protein n=1 Tax=Haloterrigena gelatinilytica TaxID=2741724 RepID=A0ABX2LCV3_9EURY|nr:hypothetical protein [Haloterrigena gelatinilytica]NUC71661.1 hypothetical protein [Haloterrigena gelatinilytica]